MPKFNINKCLIPTIYCGKGSYKSVSPSNNYSKYIKKGSPSECIKKGIGAGIYIEKKKNLTKNSLQNIPYIGPVFEKNFKSHKITTLSKLEEYIEDSSISKIKKMLTDVCTKSNGQIDPKAYNSVILYLYYKGHRDLPVCTSYN